MRADLPRSASHGRAEGLKRRGSRRASSGRNDPVSSHRPPGGPTHLSFRLEPVVAVVPWFCSPSLPQGVGSIGDILFVDERQAVFIEMPEPFVPGNRSKWGKAWKIE